MKSIVVMSAIAAALTFSACEAADEGTNTGSKAEPKANPIAVNAKKLMKEFEDNELAADKKYKGKSVKVTGVVNKIDTEVFDDSDYTVQLGGGGEYEILSVTAYDVPEDELSTIEKGQKLTLVCDFKDGGDLGVDLNHCRKA